METYHEKFPHLGPTDRVTLDEVAQELKCSPGHLRNLKSEDPENFLPFERTGHPEFGQMIFRVNDVRVWDRKRLDEKQRNWQEKKAKVGPIVSGGSKRFRKLNVFKSRALEEAKRLGHWKTTSEHLLLAVLDDPDAVAKFGRLKVDIEELRRACVAAVSKRHAQAMGEEDLKPYPTPEFEAVIAFAQSYFSQTGFTYDSKHQRGKDLKEVARKRGMRIEDVPGVKVVRDRAKPSGKKQPDGEHLLAALRLTDTPAAKLLEEHGVTKRSFRIPLLRREVIVVRYPDDKTKGKESDDAQAS